jgi:hypothetical protein
MLTQPTYSLVVVVTERPDFLAGRWAGRVDEPATGMGHGIIQRDISGQSSSGCEWSVSIKRPHSLPLYCSSYVRYVSFVGSDR